MATVADTMFSTPPTYTTVAPGQGGGPNAGAASGLLSGFMSGPGGPLLGALTSGGIGLGDKSQAEGAPQNATGWGAMNSPFIIGGSGASNVTSRADQSTPVSMDTYQRGPQSSTDAPLLSGDNGFLTIAVLGLIGLAALKVLTRKKA